MYIPQSNLKKKCEQQRCNPGIALYRFSREIQVFHKGTSCPREKDLECDEMSAQAPTGKKISTKLSVKKWLFQLRKDHLTR